VLVVVSGLPGTGKSTLARGIALARRIPVLSVDPMESALLEAGLTQSFETGLAAYLVVVAAADAVLAAGIDVVVDSVSAVEPAREMWRRLATRHGTPLRVITCAIADEAVARPRLAARERDLALPEPTWDDVRRRAGEWTPWPEPSLALDSLEPADANLARALTWLG
jgi:predicted kinase